jgi:hypothetical protein
MASPDSPAHRKIQKRLREGLCMGCGKKEVDGKCGCKHKGEVDWGIPTAREMEFLLKIKKKYDTKTESPGVDN